MSIKETVVRVGSRALLIGQKYSPEILTTVGILGGVTAAVLGAKATLKLEPIVEKIEDGIQGVKIAAEEWGVEPKQKDLNKIYIRGGLDIGQLYLPSVTLGAASIVCVVAAHGILHRRNVALVAAYKVAEGALAEYRKRFIEEYGEDKDRDYIAGVHDEVKTAKDGEVTVKTLRDPNGVSMYARFFEKGNLHWEPDSEFNKMFLMQKQNYLNNRLQRRGHIFLNEVYEELGFDHTPEGSVVGWLIAKDADCFIDFGMFDFSNEQGRKFINGDEKAILLDFNVDGVIWNKI